MKPSKVVGRKWTTGLMKLSKVVIHTLLIILLYVEFYFFVIEMQILITETWDRRLLLRLGFYSFFLLVIVSMLAIWELSRSI